MNGMNVDLNKMQSESDDVADTEDDDGGDNRGDDYHCHLGSSWLSGRMPDWQSSEAGFESHLLPFRRRGIFVLSITITHQFTQLSK